MFVVINRDCRQGDEFVVGPFNDRQTACVWAANDADERATGIGMRSGLDAGTDGGYVTISDANDEPMYEWEVQQLIDPVLP